MYGWGVNRISEAIRPLAERLRIESRNREYAAQRWGGETGELPVLYLDDVSAIPFVSVVPGVEEYQHRARVRAGDGDLFVAATPPAEGYESYCRDRLRLGSPEFVLADGGDHAYAVARACLREPTISRIVERTRQAGGLVIHPYMAIQEVWELAGVISERSGLPVQVIGPPPPVLWLANDKQRFTELVSRVLSPDWVVETHAANDPAEMARHLVRLAERHRRGGLKRTRCASAMGNAVYDLEAIARLDPDKILEEVRRFLERTEWALDEEVLIVAWEQTNDSPSTQLWIPPSEVGPPVVEGVYEQLLEGDEKIFLGSRPSRLPEVVNESLTRSSIAVGSALQSLGYVGRCSFDFIVVADTPEASQVKFVECNGRWGGTSTPMRLVDRVVEGSRPPYRAQDYMHHDLVGVGFSEIVRRLGDGLYDPSTGQGRYILYNVGPLAAHGKLDVIALGDTQAEAEQALLADFPRLLGL
jgi:hypothetical protein